MRPHFKVLIPATYSLKLISGVILLIAGLGLATEFGYAFYKATIQWSLVFP